MICLGRAAKNELLVGQKPVGIATARAAQGIHRAAESEPVLWRSVA